jgi:hypothetical protein
VIVDGVDFPQLFRPYVGAVRQALMEKSRLLLEVWQTGCCVAQSLNTGWIHWIDFTMLGNFYDGLGKFLVRLELPIVRDLNLEMETSSESFIRVRW